MQNIYNSLAVAASKIGVPVWHYGQEPRGPVELSAGYIGNTYHDGTDDRSWFVWYRGLPNSLCHNYPIYNNTPGLSLGSTEETFALTEDEFVAKVEAQWNRYCAKLAEEALR